MFYDIKLLVVNIDHLNLKLSATLNQHGSNIRHSCRIAVKNKINRFRTIFVRFEDRIYKF